MKKLLFILFLYQTTLFSQSIDLTEIEMNYIGNSNPKKFAKGITKIYFSANDGINGNELWSYDINTNKTSLVKDIGNGNDGLNNSILLTIGDILYFTVNIGTQLWRSDGTESGTYLIKNISSNSSSNNFISQLINYNGNIVFGANDNINGSELWISNGTTIGTVLLKDINVGSNGSNPYNFFVFNEYLYFVANDGINGNKIWKSDGTNSGTQLLQDNGAPTYSSLGGGNFIIFNNDFYFYAYNNTNGFELWKSDGTSAGTLLFKDIVPGTNSSNNNLVGAVANDYFIFEVNSSSIGTELWKCDGTAIGTTLLKDINTGINNGVSVNTQFAKLGNKIYFDALTVSNGLELWETDGTNIGTLLVKDINTGPANSLITKLTATSNYLIFSAKSSLNSYNTVWKSDGTTAGTFELKDTDMTQYSNTELDFVEFNNLVFFPAGNNSPNGIELWTTDGTPQNTQIFKDISHIFNGMTDFFDVAQLDNKLIYTGNNGNDKEPFVTDGTISGTRMIKDINPSGTSLFTSLGFKSGSYTKAGNFVFFRAIGPGVGYEIWKTDGTEINTSLVKDIRPGSASSISEYPFFLEYNNIFYFKANDGIHGEELWRSDGTESGTYLVKDINPGSNSSIDRLSNIFYNSYSTINENCYAILNGFLYFTANDGVDSSIWRTDGTEAGTIKVIVIPANNSLDNNRIIINATNDRIFFKSNINNSYGNNALWASDGTQSGTVLLGNWSIAAPQFKKNIIHNNQLYFTVNSNTTGVTLMKSNGTQSGTVIVKGNFTTYETFNSLHSCGNYVYFGVGAQGSYASEELWRTNGTTIGTVKLGEHPGGDLLSFILCKTCYQDNLLFKKEALNNDKIYYVNGNSTNTENYLTTNITNSENFGENGFYNYSDFYVFNNKLLIAAGKQYSGLELYSSEFNFTLDNQDFNGNENKNNVILYPNPSINKITINISDNSLIKGVKIYNLLGEEILNYNQNINEIDVSNLKVGIYLVNVFTDKHDYKTKMVIKR
ncbi:ELWxxDGT repeat protein [Flavobacterium mekongense]|uniref:ELWxxDGT repeat protein n=1 Tax=Flavobacterium mekongense TaxID=3379707 RepID=UPI00399A81AB